MTREVLALHDHPCFQGSNPMRRPLCLLGWLLVSGLVDNAAFAANRRSFFFSGKAAQTSAALIAGAQGTEALFYNPAGLAKQNKSHIDFSMTAFSLRLQKVEDALQVQFPDGVETADISAPEVLPVPSALVYARPASEDVGYAYGVYVIESSDVRFDARISRDGLVGPSGVVDFRSGISGQEIQQTYWLGGGLGWAVSERFRLGFALFAVYGREVSGSQVLFGTQQPDGSNTSFVFSAESSDIKVVGLTGSLSAQWNVVEQVDLGLTIRPPTMSMYTWGDRTPFSSSPTEDGDQTFEAGRVPINAWTVEPVAPASIELMGRWQVDDYEFGTTFEWVVPVKSNGVLEIDTRFLWNLRLGMNYHFSRDLSIGCGFYTDRSIDNADEGTTAGIDYYGLTTGLTTAHDLDSDGQVTLTTTFGLGYAAGVGQVSSVVIQGIDLTGAAESALVDTVFHELTLNVASGIRF
jgi:hypothetical protein